MPTYHNAGGGYPNVSAPARQAKLDGNQNHHTIPSNVTSHPLIQNSTQHNVPSNLSASNIPSHPVSPTMTTHSNVTTPNITSHMNTGSTPVILTSNVTNPSNPAALSVNPRHEVKLNAMPYVFVVPCTREMTPLFEQTIGGSNQFYISRRFIILFYKYYINIIELIKLYNILYIIYINKLYRFMIIKYFDNRRKFRFISYLNL